MTMDRFELRRLHDRAVGDGRRYWADSYVQNLVTAVGEYLTQDDPTVEVAYLRATIADLKAGAVIPGQNSEQLQRIRQLHHAMDGGNCAECWAAGGYDGAPEWPCATVQLCDEIESGCKPVTPKAEPQRVQPSRDDVARAIYDTEGFHAADHWGVETSITRDRYLGHADAALSVFDTQPAVAEVRAQALRDAAERIRGKAALASEAALGQNDPAWSRLDGMAFAHEDDARDLDREADGGAR